MLENMYHLTVHRGRIHHIEKHDMLENIYIYQNRVQWEDQQQGDVRHAEEHVTCYHVQDMDPLHGDIGHAEEHVKIEPCARGRIHYICRDEGHSEEYVSYNHVQGEDPLY